jgi:DNA-binding beta-propeller fold protein YncE
MGRRIRRSHPWLVALGFGLATAGSVAPTQAQQLCGGTTYPFPYTDVAAVGAAFCPGIMEAYVTGVSKGTTPTTFSPDNDVIRVQMTTFLQRSLDQGIARTSRRATLNQWATPQGINAMQTIAGISFPLLCAADGAAIWTTTADSLVEVQAFNGKVLGTWTGPSDSSGVVVAAGRVFVTDTTEPGTLYVIDPTEPPGTAATAATNLGDGPVDITFDGTHLWTANFFGASVSIITPQAATPYPPGNVHTVTAPEFIEPNGILYDGAHIWMTDLGAGKLFELDASGNILLTVSIGPDPQKPLFDGANIWVPGGTANSITVVQASTGNVVATIAKDATNKLSNPLAASFDGERILVANSGGNSVTLFKAADLSFIANVATGTSSSPSGACSDGINFWITLLGSVGHLVRF